MASEQPGERIQPGTFMIGLGKPAPNVNDEVDGFST